MSELEFNADVFHGELTANRGQVFVRVPRAPELADCILGGYVYGPRCEYAHTLPAKFVLRDMGPGPTLLARATITDPCLWTSDLPQIYDLHIELRRGAEMLASEKRQIGLRGLGVRQTRDGYYLAREGKIWIPRGVSIDLVNAPDLQSFREQLLVGVCNGIPSLDLLNEASQRGAYLIVKLHEPVESIERTLQQLARWPAVMMAVLDRPRDAGAELRNVSPNLLLAQSVAADELPGFTPAPWAQVFIVKVPADPALGSIVPQGVSQPVIVEGCSAAAGAPNRDWCDALQRLLAFRGQFAGYLATNC